MVKIEQKWIKTYLIGNMVLELLTCRLFSYFSVLNQVVNNIYNFRCILRRSKHRFIQRESSLISIYLFWHHAEQSTLMVHPSLKGSHSISQYVIYFFNLSRATMYRLWLAFFFLQIF